MNWLARNTTLLVLALASCHTAAPQPESVSEGAVLLEIPPVQKDDMHSCGLASITALCEYWGVRMPEKKRLELAATAVEDEGLTAGELRAALEKLGLDAHLFQGRLDRTASGLYGHIDAGRPPLVMLSPDGRDRRYGLVLGYDEARATLIVLDPTKGRVQTPVAEFDREWERCQHFTLLACPKDHEGEVAGGPWITLD